MPSNSFDTFFAITIIIAVAVIATAFVTTTLQARISSTQDINKDSYLKAIADRILTNAGLPTNWGVGSGVPADFGLAAANPIYPYELDMDKISRLNTLSSHSLSSIEISQSAKLYDIAFGISVSQVMALSIDEISSVIVGGNTSFTFRLCTSINSKSASAALHGYVIAENYQDEITSTVPESGIRETSVVIPTAKINGALMVIFARATIDDRITSYAIYDFQDGEQLASPDSTSLALSPLNYQLSFNDTVPGIGVNNLYVLSYSYQKTIPSPQSPCSISKLVDASPLVIVASSTNSSVFFQEWTSYPQIPLTAGANFDGSAQNMYSYLVSVRGVLYRLELSLGDLAHEDT